jgi:NADPH-dependent glutamate synthase beta subunit-like oxidoreductase/ferredoxin
MPVQFNKTGDWRFLTPVRREKTSPCTVACPLHSGVAEWVDRVSEGDWLGAWRAVSKYNPFPAITGYVCYRFCQEECSRGRFDEAVAIGEIEKELGVWRHRGFGERKPVAKAGRPKGPKVAVIGSGPAGLSCAYYLSLLGARVEIFEREPVPGGLLALGIPEYRLPRHVLSREIALLKAQGVVFHLGKAVGRDISLADLRHDFAAVYIASGAGREKKLGIPGEELPGVSGALEYLSAFHLEGKTPAATSVLVIGGGNAAIDAACVARLQGAGVALAYRRTREAMPAHPEEVKAAEEAGVQFLFQVSPQAVLGETQVEGIRLVRTDASKRGEGLALLSGSAFSLRCDLILVAIGQEPDLDFVDAGYVLASDTAWTGLPGVFGGGDAATGPANVAAAIGAGREGARAIASYLELNTSGEDGPVFAAPYDPKTAVIAYEALNPFLAGIQPRSDRPEEEAGRCLSCGRCNRCGICWLFCPDLAVEPEGDMEFLLDYCKGCGICARECPGGVLEMEVAANG